MTLTRWTPVRDFASHEVDRLNRMFDAAFAGEPMTRGGWVPPVDIYETADKDVVAKVELPGMKREDIKVTFENGVLTVEGERKFEDELSQDRYHRVERGYGAFRRSFTLPSSVDASKVTATHENGVLTIKLPRREEARPRQIEVNG